MSKTRIVTGAGGAGLFGLNLVLDRVWENPEPWILWAIGIISILLILFALFGPAILRILNKISNDGAATVQQTTVGGHSTNIDFSKSETSGVINVNIGDQIIASPNTTPTPSINVSARVKDGFAELCLHNTSKKNILYDAEISFRNYSKSYDKYVPQDILRSIIARGRSNESLKIAAGNQEYYRFATVVEENGVNYINLLLGDESLNIKIARLCVVKLRITAQQLKAQDAYLALGLTQYGELTLEPYQREK